MIKDPKELWKLVSNPTVQIEAVVEMTSEMILVTYGVSEEALEESSGNTNVVIAAFTTALARLKLYSYMEKLGRRVLYTDTGMFFLLIHSYSPIHLDSLIYVTNSDDIYTVPLGQYLGEMTDEIQEYGEDARIVMYVCTGAKSYGYAVQLADGTRVYCVKSKGFTLNWKNGSNNN